MLLVVFSLTGCAQWNYQDMSDPSRDVWQKPQGVVEKLSLARGARVADLGAGTGYFTWHLAKAVGGRGTVYAVDTKESAINMETVSRKRITRAVQTLCTITLYRLDGRSPCRAHADPSRLSLGPHHAY